MAQVDDYITSGVTEAMGHLWRQFKSGLESLDVMLKDPEGKVRANTIRNLKGLCETVKKLNITQDPGLDGIRIEAERVIADLDTVVLARDSLARGTASNKVKGLMDKFAKFNNE